MLTDFLAMINKAIVNVHTQVFVWRLFSFLLSIHVGVEWIEKSQAKYMFNIETMKQFSEVVVTFYIPTKNV